MPTDEEKEAKRPAAGPQPAEDAAQALAPGRLERLQVLVYVAALALGAGLGLLQPGAGALLGRLVWPLLGLLLFFTFLPISPQGLRVALAHRRFFAAVALGNFALVPVLVWALSTLLPGDESIRLAFLLVMLAPCTDWFNAFSYLGGGDARLSAAATPLLLFAQMLLLPVLIAILLGPEAAGDMQSAPFLRAFFTVIAVPLALALVLRAASRRRPGLDRVLSNVASLPVWLLAALLFSIAASELPAAMGSLHALARVAALYLAYLAAVPLIALAIVRLAGLGTAPARTLLFSLGTRNSFVVLPLVLAWPGVGELGVAVVVLQSLVELGGMAAYTWLVPRWLMRER